MRVLVFISASVFSAPTVFETENFVTEDEVEWELNMDSVMGGSSTGKMQRFPDHIHFTGQLDLVDGGFAGFRANIDTKLTGYERKPFLLWVLWKIL